VTVNNTRY